MESGAPTVSRESRMGWVLSAVLGTIALILALWWRLLQEPGTNYPPLSAPHRIPIALGSFVLAFLGSLLAIVLPILAEASHRLKNLALGAAPSVVTWALWSVFFR